VSGVHMFSMSESREFIFELDSLLQRGLARVAGRQQNCINLMNNPVAGNNVSFDDRCAVDLHHSSVDVH